MIARLTVRFGRAPGQTPEPLTVTPVTVFVGPNNSGKTRVLQEISQYCANGTPNAAALILKGIEFEGFPPEGANEALAAVRLQPNPGEALNPNHVFVGKRGQRHQVPEPQLLSLLGNPGANPSSFCTWYLAYNTLMLDGSSRINLVNQQGAGDLLQPPHTSFQVLFQDETRRKELRRIVYEAFGAHLIIDPTNLGQLRLRLSPKAPSSELEEQGIHAEARDFHRAAMPIEQGSDGVRAFTGIVTEVIAGDPHVILVDEPEAFLHPALAFKLGLEVSKAAAGASKRLFVSTHSPQFVMGCIQSGTPVNIVRLTYRNGIATARVLPSSDIITLMRNPLLRSTGVLSGLFYEFVVVTESDADRAFYQEVNERLLRHKPEWGIPNCLFINAQNKQTIHHIIRPLRGLGIPAAAILDIDMLKEGGVVWSSVLTGAHIPDANHQALATLRATVKQLFDKTGKEMKREGGVSLLQNGDRETAENLLDQLATYGVFAVRGGELEGWLSTLGATGHGPAWLTDVFQRMGEDPAAAGYVVPGEGDVWAFMKSIRDWLVAADRKGIPV